jgi:hypothetical protein
MGVQPLTKPLELVRTRADSRQRLIEVRERRNRLLELRDRPRLQREAWSTDVTAITETGRPLNTVTTEHAKLNAHLTSLVPQATGWRSAA